MKNALIGCSGFVGQTLLKQTQFDELYRSTNISDIRNQSYGMIVCAGAPAAKWFANQHPEEDKAGIHQLIDHLSTVTCQRFVLISTVDVYQDSTAVVESTPVDPRALHPYGVHRFQLEEFVKKHFSHALIIRLPGLVGPGLKKNVIYDFLHRHHLDAIDSRSIFQFYPMVNLWTDIQIALQSGQPLVHLTSEPISVDEVAKEGFGFEFNQHITHQPAAYDFRTELGWFL
ncbi:pyridine nucleotide transhydrogenase [Vibrio sp. PP-XX7]